LTRLGQFERRDLGVERDRRGVGGRLGVERAQEAVRFDPGASQEVGGRSGRGDEAGQEVLGADGSAAIEGLGLMLGVTQGVTEGRGMR
jgi:hypothetical protein